MKFYKVMLLSNPYVLASSSEEAREVAKKALLAGELALSEEVAVELQRMDDILPTHRERTGAMVADSVTDDEFKKIKGRNNAEIFNIVNDGKKAKK